MRIYRFFIANVAIFVINGLLLSSCDDKFDYQIQDDVVYGLLDPDNINGMFVTMFIGLLNLMRYTPYISSRQTINTLQTAVTNHRQDADPNDDITMLCIRLS